MKRLVSGIKPTGNLTLGNYLGAIKNFIALQSEYESYIFVADLHTLTVPIAKEELKKQTMEVIGFYLACGLNPDKTTLFLQSDNLYHTNLSWILECNSYMGELNRMTQFKEKSQNLNNESIGCGLFTYPVLMASDILLYDADIVPVGIDQKQHVELCRNIAIRFNNKYGLTFKVPEPIVPKIGAKIYDLQDPTKKMSKTGNDKGCILLIDEPDIARKKIMGAITDSDNRVIYDPDNKPGISNLMTIYSLLTNTSFIDIEKQFIDANYGTFKTAVADIVCEFLLNIQTKYKAIVASGLISKVLDEGAKKTTAMAKEKYQDVKNKVGLGL